jgi:hypothetical protein
MPDLAMNVGFQGESRSNGDDAKPSRLTQSENVSPSSAAGFGSAWVLSYLQQPSSICGAETVRFKPWPIDHCPPFKLKSRAVVFLPWVAVGGGVTWAS